MTGHSLRDLNALERAIAAVSPEWGLRRLAAKVNLDISREAVRGFDGARRDRRTAGWNATGGSASAELGPALDTLRRRSRDLIRNNEWAINAKRKLTSHIVGTGFIPRPVQGTKAQKKRARELWNEFSENCDPQGLMDFGGKQAQQIGEVIESGACFVRWYLRPSDWGLKVPLQCEVLEHEHLDTIRTEVRGDNVIVHGVEYDQWGRRVAYWLFPHHPGDISVLQRARYQSQRIPASEVDHIFRVDRPGQVTGVPWLAPTMLRLRDRADFEEARLIQEKIAACLTVFVKKTGTASTNIVQAQDTAKDDKGRRLEKIKPGMIAYLQPNEEITTATPNPTSGYGEFMTEQSYASAAGVGLTHAQFSGDLRQVNYSGLREGKLDFWTTLDPLQYNMVIPQSSRPAWRRAMAAAAGRGHAIAADIRAEFTPPRRPWVDPLKDVKAVEMEMALGLASWEEEVAARGLDPELHLENLIKQKGELAKAGIVFSSAPGIADQPQEAQDVANAKA